MHCKVYWEYFYPMPRPKIYILALQAPCKFWALSHGLAGLGDKMPLNTNRSGSKTISKCFGILEKSFDLLSKWVYVEFSRILQQYVNLQLSD